VCSTTKSPSLWWEALCMLQSSSRKLTTLLYHSFCLCRISRITTGKKFRLLGWGIVTNTYNPGCTGGRGTTAIWGQPWAKLWDPFWKMTESKKKKEGKKEKRSSDFLRSNWACTHSSMCTALHMYIACYILKNLLDLFHTFYGPVISQIFLSTIAHPNFYLHSRHCEVKLLLLIVFW
jgi:hypothetical protein